MWILASIVSKQMTLRTYSKVTDSKIPGYNKHFPEVRNDDVPGLNGKRRKLQRADVARARLSFAAMVLMVIGLF